MDARLFEEFRQGFLVIFSTRTVTGQMDRFFPSPFRTRSFWKINASN
jgi:hypothetical protein